MIFLLLIVFQIKHYLCDYPLQSDWMAGKKHLARNWEGALAAHAGVHAAFTFAIVFTYLPAEHAILAAAFDFIMHFVMDRIKASPYLLGKYKALSYAEYRNSTAAQKRDNRVFWRILGLDQMWHHLTHYAIIYYILYVLTHRAA